MKRNSADDTGYYGWPSYQEPMVVEPETMVHTETIAIAQMLCDAIRNDASLLDDSVRLAELMTRIMFYRV